MSKIRSTWGKLSSYAESFSDRASSASLTKAAAVGAAVGAGYTSIDQGNISAPLSGSGFINMGIGAAAGLATRKYATSIYNKVDDQIERHGINRKTYDSIYDKAQAALERRQQGHGNIPPKKNPSSLGKFEEFIKEGKNIKAMRFQHGTYNVPFDRIDA